MQQTTVHLGDDQAAWLERAKAKWGVSKSDIVRRALDPYIQSHPVNESPVESAPVEVAHVEVEANHDRDETPSGQDGEVEQEPSWWNRSIF